MHKKFEIHRTKIKGGCQSGRKVVTHNSKIDLPLVSTLKTYRIVSFSIADAMAAQLNSVRLKLEQRRKRIEDEKRKMEAVMAKQREKVGQEAFLRAVVKGTVIINPR